ncbi:MAG: helix-turn-helix domain-containing protein [Candidatus Sericytochromatia bacterium]
MTKHKPLKPHGSRFTAIKASEVLSRQGFLVEFTPETLRMLRLHREYTQVQLARLASVSADYLSELERGLSQPSIELMGRLGTALQVIFFK